MLAEWQQLFGQAVQTSGIARQRKAQGSCHVLIMPIGSLLNTCL